MQGARVASWTPDRGGVTDAIWLLKVETEFPALEFVGPHQSPLPSHSLVSPFCP